MMLSKFLDPKNEYAFKKVFGTQEHKDIVVHFLNDMLGIALKEKIKDVTFLNPNQDPESADKKASIVDVLCRDERGKQFIIEMQVAKKERTLYEHEKKKEWDRCSELNTAVAEEKRRTAKNLLEQGIPINVIITATGLTEQEINSL